VLAHAIAHGAADVCFILAQLDGDLAIFVRGQPKD
jgi:hypothetical protein